MKKPTKKQTIAATKKSIKHWEENVESYPMNEEDYEKEAWFDENCQSDDCALCHLLTDFDDRTHCKWCPLGPRRCCSQWETLCVAIEESGTSTIKHVRAVLNKLKKELNKLLSTLD